LLIATKLWGGDPAQGRIFFDWLASDLGGTGFSRCPGAKAAWQTTKKRGLPMLCSKQLHAQAQAYATHNPACSRLSE
jgi:hypothetical protein